jgi:hypothetical protein
LLKMFQILKMFGSNFGFIKFVIKLNKTVKAQKEERVILM